MKKTPIVEPIDCRETVDQLEAALSAAGLPEELARKVSILLCEGSLFKDELYSDGVPEQVRSDHIESLANRMGTAFCRTGRNKHDRALVEMLQAVVGPESNAGGIHTCLNLPSGGNTDCLDWLNSWFFDLGIDWARGVGDSLSDTPDSLKDGFLQLLAYQLAPEQQRRGETPFVFELMNSETLRAILSDPAPESPRRTDERIGWLLGWYTSVLTLSGLIFPVPYSDMLSRLMRELRTMPGEAVGSIALGADAKLLEATEDLRREPRDLARTMAASDANEAYLEAVLESGLPELLLERWVRYPEDRALRMAAYRFVPMSGQRRMGSNAGALLSLRRAAQADLGRTRQVLSAKKPDVDEFDWPLRRLAADYLRQTEGPWAAIKPLLLALAASSVQVVTSDLRYWSESGKGAPPEHWHNVPRKIAGVFRSLRPEQEKDQRLLKLRTRFAEFCLERLKTRKGVSRNKEEYVDTEFVETRPNWRYFYIRAVRELKVNPRGRGHRTLHWASENDPHEQVRLAARAAYKELRRGLSLPAGVSPRRPLYAVFWWLRQAHLKHLGVEVDERGAQRTRSKELMRTNEK